MNDLWVRVTLPCSGIKGRFTVTSKATKVPESVTWPELRKWRAGFNTVTGWENPALSRLDDEIFNDLLSKMDAISPERVGHWGDAKFSWVHVNNAPYDVQSLEREHVGDLLKEFMPRTAKNVIEQLLQEMPQYRLGYPEAGVKMRPNTVVMKKPSLLIVNDIDEFQKLIDKDFKYIRIVFDEVAELIWAAKNEHGIPDDAIDNILWQNYADEKATDRQDTDERWAERLNELVAFIQQASEPGDKLYKVAAAKDVGEGLFILCPPDQEQELKRLAIIAGRNKVSREIG